MKMNPVRKWLNGGWRTSWVGRRLNRASGFFELVMMRLYRSDEDFQMLMNLLLHEEEFCFKPSELFTIYSIAKAKSISKGDFAEVGVFRGMSAEVICRVKGDSKTLWLFDTFEGMPQVGRDSILYPAGTFRCGMEVARTRLSKWNGVHLVKGLFPQTADPTKDKTFAFVHLDADLYESIISSLRHFWPRLEPGGIIIAHDYGRGTEVKQAFDEFFKDAPKRVVELPLSQCMVIKDS
jgi:O-methyltransferase